jgi:cellulose synthase/poly-beta-1,6-N-acetylglucosamine synthase-like glycosyltransferase
MHLLFDLPLLCLAICAALPSLWFFIECMLGALYRPEPPPLQAAEGVRVAVLMPAHNESAGIALTVQALTPQLSPTTELWVVADNCTDDTAQLAARSGKHVHVLERHDTERRGKGYALAYGLDQLAAQPPDVVVIMDADCEVSAQGIARLAQRALQVNAPVQADYVLTPAQRPSGRSVVSALAFLVKNRARPRGLAALGQPCLLTGTGMGFPWEVLRKAPPTDDHLVEDMVMGLELAHLGHAPRLCPDVCVTSALPEKEKAASSQRKRWEHGHLATMLSHCPRLFARGIASRRLDLIALALELCVPPLSLLVLMLVAATGVCAVAAILGASGAPLAITVLSLMAIGTGVLAAWLAYGRELVRARDLLAIPLYVLWKLPLYFSFFTKGKQRAWERTERTETPKTKPS